MKSVRSLFVIALTITVSLNSLATTLRAADELVDLIVNLIREPDKDLRAVGLEQVRTEAKGAEATRQFAAQLPKLSADAQVGLLSALADRGDAAARPALLELFAGSNDESVRAAAASALGFLGNASDAPLLVKSLGGGSKAESAAARKSLVRLPGDAAPAAIAAELKQAAPPLKVTLIEILTARRALGTIGEIAAAAQDDEPTVRTAAMVALGQLAAADQFPSMVRGVLKAHSGAERDAAERAIALVCSRIEAADKRTEPLFSAMATLKPAEWRILLSTLGRVGGSAALREIEAAIGSADAELHDIGIRALCNWPDASVAPRLIELTKADTHAAHQALAFKALIRVAPLPDNRPDAERLELVKQVWSMCSQDDDRNRVLQRARAIRTVETLRFVAPFMSQPTFAQQACETVVELAHHRALRDANKAEFHQALDIVIKTSKDATVVERANRYKKGQTWTKPMAAEQ